MNQTRLAQRLVMMAILLLTACSGVAAAAQSCVRCGVVAVSHPLAAAAGARILARGGNAIDAAAAVQFALNVVEPQSSGIGGGGFMMVHLGKTGETFVVDSRERAPAAASAEMFLQDGTAMSFDTASASGLAVGVPGTLLGVDTALHRWGTLRLADTLAPAIALAAQGFRINHFLAADIANDNERTRQQPETAAIFHPGGVPLAEGELLVQPDLAKTLKLIAAKGPGVFYRGPIAHAIVAAQQRSRTTPASIGAGRMTLADLDHYRVVIRQPLIATYRGWTVVGTPPPSSGGLTVMQILKLLEAYPLGDTRRGFGFGSANTLHVMIEAMRLAFADRAVWIGDEDFIAVPKHGLLHPAYLATRAHRIHLDQRMATPAAGNPLPYENTHPPAAVTLEVIPSEVEKGLHTTHFSIVDHWGNIVSYTSTIENTWGSGITVPSYGFLLNNELTDFNFVPAANRTTGNPGANDIAPHKRPRSSMAPMMLFKGKKPFAAYGSPGGSTIINSVLNTTLNLIDHHMSLQQAIDAPRLSVTDAAGTVSCEGIAPFMQARFSIPTQDALRALGHQSFGERGSHACTATIGSVQGIAIDLKTGIQYGAADQRREGTVITVPNVTLRGMRQRHHANSARP
ncbi:MAG: gamma-glutamyltransferase [Thiobacillaceae bacterium]